MDRARGEAGGAGTGAEEGRRSPAWVVLVLAMLAVAVAQSFGRFTYPVLLPAMRDEVIGSYAIAGALGTLNLAAYLLGTFLVSRRGGRIAPVRLVVGGLVATTLALTLLAVAPGAALVAVALVVTGLAGAAIWLPLPGLAGAVVSPARRGTAMGVISAGVGIGITVAGQLSSASRRIGGDGAWRWVWGIEAAVGALAVVLVARFLHVGVHRPAHAARSSSGFSALREVPGWVPLTVSYAAYGLAFTLFTSFLVTALEEDAGFSESHASTVYAVLGVAVIVGGLALGRLSDRVGRRGTIVGGFVLMAACVLGVLVHAEPWVTVCAFGFGLMFSGIPAPIAAHVADHVDPARFPAAFGAITLCFGMAALVGPQLGGLVADATGSFTVTFALSALAAGGGAVAGWFLPRTGHRGAPVVPASAAREGDEGEPAAAR